VRSSPLKRSGMDHTVFTLETHRACLNLVSVAHQMAPPLTSNSSHLIQRYPASIVNFIAFTKEKVFTVTCPTNTENDRHGTSTKRVPAACTSLTFSHSVTVSVGVLALCKTSTHFVEPGVKVNRHILHLQDR